jgi:HK97 family phage prohead protease
MDFITGTGKVAKDSGTDGRVFKFRDDVEVVSPAPFCLGVVSHDKGHGTGEPILQDAFPWTFSTFHLDRHDEKVDPKGWDVARFLENPVIEWAHCYSIPAIGKAVDLFVDDKGLCGSIVFNDKEYDVFGWAVGQRVKAGVIRAASVGFRALEIEIPKGDDVDIIFRKQELMEVSVCNVPANPWALAGKKAPPPSLPQGGRNDPFFAFIGNSF